MFARLPVFLHMLLSPDSAAAQAPNVAAIPRHWQTFAAGLALSLRPKQAATMQVVTGRAWVTLGGPYVGHDDESGDLSLEAGDRLAVPVGARVVVEAASTAKADPLRFDWCEPSLIQSDVRPSREVLAPAGDLMKALGQSTMALGRLTWGVLGLADVLVAGRGRVLSQWESNPP